MAKIVIAALLTIFSVAEGISKGEGPAQNRMAAAAGLFARVGNYGSKNSPVLMFSHNDVLYVSVTRDESGIYRSLDLGKTWTPITEGILSTPFYGRYISARAKVGGELFVSGAGVYRLNNEGNSWIPASNGLPSISGLPQNFDDLTAVGSTLFVVQSNPNVSGPKDSILLYRSRKLGADWELIPGFKAQRQDLGLPRLAGNGATLLVATGEGMFRSTDEGNTFLPANAGLEAAGAQVQRLIASGDDFFAAVSDGTVFRSSDQGLSWSKVSKLGGEIWDPRILMSEFVADGANLLIGVNYNLYLTTDRGRNFRLLDDGVRSGVSGTPSAFLHLAVIQSQIFTLGTNFLKSEGEVYAGAGFLPPSAVAASAASFNASRIAPDSIAAIFGAELATAVQIAPALPLPTRLAGTEVMITDTLGVKRPASLFYVSPGQVNCLIPAETGVGIATFQIRNGAGAVTLGSMRIQPGAPALFTANSDGQGAPAALAYRYRNGLLQSIESVVQSDPQGRLIPKPIQLGSEEEQVFLVLYGTGIRRIASLQNLRATIGGVDVPIAFAGQQGAFLGLDQINLALPRTMAGRGEVDLVLSVDPLRSNVVNLHIQ